MKLQTLAFSSRLQLLYQILGITTIFIKHAELDFQHVPRVDHTVHTPRVRYPLVNGVHVDLGVNRCV